MQQELPEPDNTGGLDTLFMLAARYHNTPKITSLYDVLGLEKTASAEDVHSAIKQRYSLLGSIENPTTYEDYGIQASAVSEILKTAEKILLNQNSRELYDATLEPLTPSTLKLPTDYDPNLVQRFEIPTIANTPRLKSLFTNTPNGIGLIALGMTTGTSIYALGKLKQHNINTAHQQQNVAVTTLISDVCMANMVIGSSDTSRAVVRCIEVGTQMRDIHLRDTLHIVDTLFTACAVFAAAPAIMLGGWRAIGALNNKQQR